MRFTLTLFPEGRALLSTEQQLSADEARRIQDLWKGWLETPQGLAVIADCQVLNATSVDIEISDADSSD